jgi:signal transduction histidine kinase
MWRGISLANKCLLLFGGAIVLIVLMALSVPWLRMNALLNDGQLELSRRMAETWMRVDDDQAATNPRAETPKVVEHGGILALRLDIEQAEKRATEDRFLAWALRRFKANADRIEVQDSTWAGLTREYRYAHALAPAMASTSSRASCCWSAPRWRPPGCSRSTPPISSARAWWFLAGCAGLLPDYAPDYPQPVRALKETAERVREGDLTIRSEISTGDEFEELSGTFNAMLGELARNQDQLRAINSALDVKLNELAEANSALYEAARMKGEFLANVSHELRTPLNSIIGFAELLREAAQSEVDAGDDSTRLTKRIRYLENISTASRNLLEMINSLLEMARIEAGKAELSIAPLNVRDACQGLLALISPLAERKGIELKLEAAEDLPSSRPTRRSCSRWCSTFSPTP